MIFKIHRRFGPCFGNDLEKTSSVQHCGLIYRYYIICLHSEAARARQFAVLRSELGSRRYVLQYSLKLNIRHRRWIYFTSCHKANFLFFTEILFTGLPEGQCGEKCRRRSILESRADLFTRERVLIATRAVKRSTECHIWAPGRGEMRKITARS